MSNFIDLAVLRVSNKHKSLRNHGNDSAPAIQKLADSIKQSVILRLPTDRKKLWDYYKQFYANKSDNLEIMYKFLEK